jgi:hypothetical protein
MKKAFKLIQECTEDGVFTVNQGLSIESLVKEEVVLQGEIEELVEQVGACNCCILCEKKCKGYKKSPVGSPRQRSFCSRMCGHKKKNTSSKTAEDRDSCINQALRRWKCRCG